MRLALGVIVAGCSPPPLPDDPKLGDLAPTTAHYVTSADGGFSPNVFFSDDVRNGRGSEGFGRSARLTVRAEVVDGLVLPLVSDDDAARGQVPSSWAAFTHDGLSGRSLDGQRGSLTIVSVPTVDDPRYRIALRVPDAGVDASFVVTNACL